jgi:hypothetical protein
MTITLTREEAQQVLDALELECTDADGKPVDLIAPAIETLRARLSAPEPDAPTPRDQYCYERGYQRALEVIRQTPQREWQGLTDEEIDTLYWDNEDAMDAILATQAKLREKNT